jgi:hypothetical protein
MNIPSSLTEEAVGIGAGVAVRGRDVGVGGICVGCAVVTVGAGFCCVEVGAVCGVDGAVMMVGVVAGALHPNKSDAPNVRPTNFPSNLLRRIVRSFLCSA